MVGLVYDFSMSENITVTIQGTTIPAHFVRLFTYNDQAPLFRSDITGPPSAFEFQEGPVYDKVRVLHPEEVEISVLRRLV